MPPPLQISIPSTTTSTTSPPHTLYNITLTLPLRSHILSKRYSDFLTLHTSLVSETKTPPPLALPPKSWLRSTTSSSALTETRRRQLESYLRCILDSDDNRWRQSRAWRSFLELPASMTERKAGTTGDAEERLDANAWLAVHREIRNWIHEARLGVRKRELATTATEQHAGSAEVKAQLVKAATGIARCEGALKGLGGEAGDGWGVTLGEGEVRRRRDMLAAARKEVEGLETQLRSLASSSLGAGAEMASAVASQADKKGLWEGTSAGPGRKTGRVLGGPAKETERTRELDNRQVLQLQKDVMEEQEQDVLEIGKAVSRMKEMGILINEELVVQNQMLGLVEADVDRVQSKLDVGKKRIAKIH
ncbi:Vacuolar morphoproteinsis protein 7 [Sphaceloma murrayae]|uniref:Vacuolar morphoproteinsis protein 7 n=1 Tax=Sphaceloma murrayae TaxID=2082308 RepID=A0A2K1QYK7_9PEZI|nr:Vacuolar morphoproteinsis protein 7 [Sphaceloma murrayae]